MAKGGEVEARWRVHGDAWKASGGTQRAYCQEHELKITRSVTGTSALAKESGSREREGTLTLVPAVLVPGPTSSVPSLSLHGPQGWRLDFAALPPVGWLSALWGER